MPEEKKEPNVEAKDAAAKPKEYKIDPEAPRVETKRRLKVGDLDLEYTASVGYTPLRSELGEVEAGIFSTAYTVVSEKPRPLTFTFNGGPGSSSVWLHLGGLGPERVALDAEGLALPPPYRLESNLETWLRFTDLVFIDPVGTGFSRSVKKDDEKKFWGLQGDLDSVGSFIRTYLSTHDRWLSPLFIAGESYGTTRAAGLSDLLYGFGIGINGIVLVSSILNFQTARFTRGNDLPYVLFFPTYAATAWYHKKLSAALQAKPLTEFLEEVQKFVEAEYAPALQAGDGLSAAKRKSLVAKLAKYSGLSPEYVDLADMRINIHRFCKELLRSERRTVGRLDSRYKGIDGIQVAETPDYDPASTIGPAFASCINDHLRRTLGFRSDLPYYVSNPGELWKHWDWGSAGAGFPDTSEALRAAISKNPYTKTFVASGYYDLATPYYATQYTLDHMGLEPELKRSIDCGYYEAGHMMYVREAELKRLRSDVEAFYASALGG